MTIPLSKYPISRELQRIQLNSGLSRHNFALVLGYKNVNGALKKLDASLTKGHGDKELFRRILDHFPDEAESLLSAITETNQMMVKEKAQAKLKAEEEARNTFKPYIFVKASLTRPTFITAAALTGFSMRFIHLKENRPHTISEIAKTVRAHYERNEGKCTLFGDITGYVYVREFEESVSLDVTGQVIEIISGKFEVPFAGSGVRISGKSVDGLLKNVFRSDGERKLN